MAGFWLYGEYFIIPGGWTVVTVSGRVLRRLVRPSGRVAWVRA